MPDAQVLIARLVALRSPGHVPSDEERQRYAKLPTKELEHMVTSLERGSALAASSRQVAPGDAKARKALRASKEKALADLDALAERIAARKALPALTQARQMVYSDQAEVFATLDNDTHFEQILGLLSHRHDPSILWSMRLRSVLDEYTETWRRTAVDRFADIIVQSEPGNLITTIETKFRQPGADALTKADFVEHYLEFALQKTSWGVMRLLDKHLQAGAGNDRAWRRLLSEYARTSVFEPSFLTDPNPALTAGAATEALAKLYLFGNEFQPTRIISVGSGGEMVGRFLRSEMRLDRRRFYHCDFRAGELRDVARVTSDSDRVLIVSDVAGGSRDLERLREALGAHIPATSIAFAALSGRASTYETLRVSPLVYFVNLTARHDARLPWGRSGSYHRTSASHFFGHSGPTPLRIAKDFFASVTEGIMSLVR